MAVQMKFKKGDIVIHRLFGLCEILNAVPPHTYLVKFITGNGSAIYPEKFLKKAPDSINVNDEIKKAVKNIMDKRTKSTNDVVNHPAHYAKNGENECIEVMRWLFGDEAVKAYCCCNIFKYRFRSNLKNGQEDIEKSVWYENYLHGMLLEKNHAN